MTNRPDPAPKPDHIRSLRDLAANFVRAIDRTALTYEDTATADLSERVASLVALHDFEQNYPDLAKTPTGDLRSRVSLLRQLEAKYRQGNLGYDDCNMTNGELRKRIEYLRQFAEVKGSDDITGFTDEALETIKEQSTYLLKERTRKREREEREARRKARAEAARDTRFIREDDEETDVTDLIEDADAA